MITTHQWIGKYSHGNVSGLFDTDKKVPAGDTQLGHLILNDNDLVTVTDIQPDAGAESSGNNNTDPGLARRKIEHLAHAGTPAAQVYEVLAGKGLNPCHPAACEQEARAWLNNPGLDSADLTDLTALPFVTIDNEDSKDLDQAIYIARSNTGQLQVHYALADAAYYVRPGSATFSEALNRAVTYYVPGLSVPMLPRALSEDLVSLNPNVKRRALLFHISIDREGEVTETRVSRAVIKSHAKLAYLKVQQFYDHLNSGKQHPYSDTDYGDSLLNLREAGQRRILHAERRDVVDHNRREPSVTLTRGHAHNKPKPSPKPKVSSNHTGALNEPISAGFAIHLRERVDCEKYNEQISLLCNMEGARLLEQLQEKNVQTKPILQSIFRLHSPPLQQRLDQLRATLEQLCIAHNLGDEYRWKLNQPLADYVSSLPDERNDATAIANATASTGDTLADATANTAKDNVTRGPDTGQSEPDLYHLKLAIERMILLTNRASFFSDEPGPHHALGVQSYARFSSPMREMAGIFTHKELLEALGLEQPLDNAQDEKLQDLVVTAANAAKKIQKELDQEFHLLAIDSHLHNDLLMPLQDRPVRHATIMGMRSGKIYVSIDSFGSDVKLYHDDLGKHFNCKYRTTDVSVIPEQHKRDASTPTSATNPPVFIIGGRVSLRLSHYDPGNRRFVLLPV